MSSRLRRLIYEHGFTEQDEVETPLRGYRSHVVAELENDSRYRLVFFDPVRLRQELEQETASGHPFIGEPGLVILPEVTRENMERAAAALCVEGFFDHLKPVSD